LRVVYEQMCKVNSFLSCCLEGLNACAVAKHMGARQVIAVAGSEKHIELAKAMGATTIINRHKENPVEAIRKCTNGTGPHVVLEMSGNQHALNQALEAVMTTGMVTILGESTSFDPQ
jgi:threonine dehydrogenase-like Zn-dependent dehydrogenase